MQDCAHQEFLPLTGDEPEAEACIPDDMPEEYNAMEIAPPFEQNSPRIYGLVDDWPLDQAFG